jgi:hypothetical protein
MSQTSPYNPLDKANLGRSVADALLGRKPRALGDLMPFDGAGIYAIYYKGRFKPYFRLAELNYDGDPQAPIYVGKAIPEGGRKGGGVEGASTKALFRRLREHAESIRAVTESGIDISDFDCRYLVVDDIWIPLGESLLIAKFAPIWNVLVDGFGNHDPGKGRYNGLVPRWDVLHPGRGWAAKCKPRDETAADIARDIESHLAAAPSLVRARFYAEQRRATYQVDRPPLSGT